MEYLFHDIMEHFPAGAPDKAVARQLGKRWNMDNYWKIRDFLIFGLLDLLRPFLALKLYPGGPGGI